MDRFALLINIICFFTDLTESYAYTLRFLNYENIVIVHNCNGIHTKAGSAIQNDSFLT